MISYACIALPHVVNVDHLSQRPSLIPGSVVAIRQSKVVSLCQIYWSLQHIQNTSC